MTQLRLVAIPLFLAFGLAACSGDSGEKAQTQAQPPAAAGADVAPSQTPSTSTRQTPASEPKLTAYKVPAGSRPHDVAPAPDGGIWYTAQGSGKFGHLDPRTGAVKEVALGTGSAPHGVIAGPDGAAWITDGGQNAIVRVDPATGEVKKYPLPGSASVRSANLNTAVFDNNGKLWFTGQGGVYGSLDPKTGSMTVEVVPRGPYGITATPNGDVYYASLASNHIARIDAATGKATKLEPPTANQGARRVWSDSKGRVWVSEWNSGQVAMYDPAANAWQEWKLPGDRPQAYAVYVDENDDVWLSDFTANTLVRFDPDTGGFKSFDLPSKPGNVRQIHGRPGQILGAESANDQLIVIEF
jgi:virginiamycin B lyase